MTFDTKTIAGMVINPAAGPKFTESKIASDWESNDPTKTLLQRLQEVADEYARNIDTEIVWDENRKIQAVKVELELRIRPISR